MSESERGEESAESIGRLVELMPIGGAVLLFAGTLAIIAMVLMNLDAVVGGFYAIVPIAEMPHSRVVASFFVVFTPPTLYVIGGVNLWVIAFDQ